MSAARLFLVVMAIVMLAFVAPVSAQTPLNAGGLTALPPVVLSPNVVNNPGFEAGATNWTVQGNGWTVDATPANAHSSTKSLRLDSSQAQFATTQPVVLHKGIYTLSAWIKTSAVTSPFGGGGVRITLDLRPGGVNAWYSSHAASGTSGWTQYQVTAYIPSDNYQAAVSLENFAAGSGISWFDDIQLVQQTDPPVDAYMLYPNYRGMIFDDHQPRTMKFSVTPAAGNGTRTVTVAVKEEWTGTVVHTETFASPGQHFAPEIDASYMLPTDAAHPTRAYRVTFSIDTTPPYSFPDFRVSLVPASARTVMNVSFDDDNNVLIRGEPQFILGLYDSNGAYFGTQAAWDNYLWSPTGDRRLANVPLNLYLNYIYGAMPAGPTEQLISSLRSHGAGYLQTGNCGGGIDFGDFIINNSDAYVQEVDAYGGPGNGITGFYVADECTVDNVPIVFNQYVRLRGLAPDTMTLAVLFPNPDVPAWRDAADVLATDPYPLYGAEPAGGYDHGLVASYTALTRNTVMDSRPFFTVLQFFKSTDNSRWPTLAEMRSHAYMAIVEGSKGLFWWSVGNQSNGGDLGSWCRWADQGGCPTGKAPSREQLMAQLTSVMQELAGTLPQADPNLPDALVAKDASCALPMNSNAAIKTKVKLFGGKGYIFAYNSLGPSSGSQAATFTWNSAPGTITVNAELVNGQPRHITPSGTSFTDSFAPYEAHVYVIQNGGSCTPGPLQLVFTNPQPNATLSGTVTVSVAASGGSGSGYNYTISANGTQIYAGTSGTTSWNTSLVPSGDYILTATVTDASNPPQVASAPELHVKVNTPHTVTPSITSPAANATVSGTITVNMSVANASGSANRFQLFVDNAIACDVPSATATASCQWNTLTVPNGLRTLSLTVTDAGGATGTTNPNVSVTVNNPTGMTAAITSPLSDALVTGTTSVGMSVTGASGNSNKFDLYLDGNLISTQNAVPATTASYAWDTLGVLCGRHTLSVTVTDALNHVASSAPPAAVTVNNPFVVAITAPSAGQTVSGTNWVAIWWQGACGAVPTYTITVDGVSVAQSAASSPQPTTVPWDTRLVGDGPRTITVTAVDGSGQVRTATRNVTVSNGIVGMTAAITSPTGGSVSGTVTVNASVTGASGSSNKFQLLVDGAVVATTTVSGSTAAFSWETLGLLNGAHTLAVVVTDATTRTATSPQVTPTVSNPFTVFITAPTAGQTVSGTNWVAIWWQGASVSAPTFDLTVGGRAVGHQATSGQPTTVAWDTTLAGDGAQTLTVTATDGAGQVRSTSVNIVVGNMTASITSPAPGATASGTVTVTMRATGTTGSANTFALSVDGTVVSTQTVAATTASYSWTTAGLLNGNHTLSVTVTDAGGRSVTSPGVTVNVSNAFAVFITAPSNGQIVSGTNWVAIWWQGASVSVPNYTITVDGQTVAQHVADGQPTTIPWNTTSVGNGTHTLTVTGVDGAGHVSAPSVSVTVSN